ncbi:ankyrin repeat-containing domain protein [Plectosphaerella cucumerina]|uniref:Ankyrin repeat-containing domain protein n=1 Tax=Plectosphaerella cucumerina TaxID=40658 RepID=A0A8K0XAH5_9PEZI|nr:ankyrin repeat-containing domain protein [Plectosphaerella cucumerina]
MTSHRALDSPDSYTIAWIAALPIERAAAEAMLDEEHAPPTGFARHQTDANVYTWGRVGEHNIAIASLAAGVYGIASAATTASSLLASLPSIRVGLLVGIGGGIARPDEDRDIRLGDVVVSQPDGTTGGVCQYDLIKAKSGGMRERKGFLGRPPTVLLNALASIQADHERRDSKVPVHLQDMLEKNPKMGKKTKKSPGYAHQGFENDRLFQASCDHVPGSDCQGCDAAGVVARDARESADPEIHYGTIASGNTLVKDAAERDRIVEDVGENCLCFEMEAAGLMNAFPCLVIRGICDYADAHKNDRWQRYASATAAAYAKELLAYVPAVEVQETKRALEVLQSVDQKLDHMQQTTSAKRIAVDHIRPSHHTDKMERWLRPPDPSTNANHARKLRHEGTGAWLLAHPVFQSWHSGSRCGKTVLSTTVLDHVAADNERLLINFFFDFSDATKQTVDGMLRSLAFQLYQRGAGSSVLDDSFQAHQDGLQQPATKALEDIVVKMLAVQQKVCVVLDALDESTTRSDLLSWIKDVTSRTELSHVQLICTSRPEAEFLREISTTIGEDNHMRLDKQAVDADIRSYVAAQLAHRRDFQDKGLSHDLLETIEMALACLPRDLDETYRRMLKSIPFLVHAKRPLRLAEAVDIIATNPDAGSTGFNIKRRLFREADVLEYCPSLVVVVHAADKELHLSHFSVKEYLLKNSLLQLPTAGISITRTCLTYLADIGGNHAEIKRNFPLARFAAEVWVGFAASVEGHKEVMEPILRFMQDEVTFQRWCRLYQQDKAWDGDPGPAEGTRLYYACLGGLYRAAKLLLQEGADVNAQGGMCGNSLQAASSEGHVEVVKLLLVMGADVKAQGGFYGNALQAAALWGHVEILKLLLEKGADVNLQDGMYGNALKAASFGGCVEIVKLLLEKGADVNAQDDYDDNPLHAASSEGHVETVKLLLQKGADINAKGGDYGTALQAASSRGQIETVDLLLEKGADVNLQGGMYGNALKAASSGGYAEIVKLLLEKGADINAQDDYFNDSLQAASFEGHVETVKLLFEKGADINARDGTYGTGLQAASLGGHVGTVKLLLEKGADVNAQGGEYGTALQAASSRGRIETVDLLLEKGADVNAQGGEYGNALQAASYRGHVETVKLLLEKGADVNAQGGEYGHTPLSWASENGYESAIRLLLSTGNADRP